MPPLIPYVVTALVSVAVQKVVQAISGQSLKPTTIPIGPFNITIGAGKPSYGVGLNIPIGKGVGITFGVQAGSGMKPSWSVGVALSGKGPLKGTKFTVTPEYEWSGGEFREGDPSISAGLQKYKTETDFTNKNPTWKIGGEWSTEKFSVNAGTKSGQITLTKPKKGSITVDLDVYYIKKIDPKTGKEIKLSVGVKLGKGKPIYQLGAGIDLNKNFRIDLDKTFGNQLNKMAVSLTRYKVEKDKRTKIAQKGIYKYDAATKTSTFQLEGKEILPISFNIENKEFKNVIIDTDAITKYISDKLVPYPEDISWQKKLGQLIEEPILKGVKFVSGEKIPDKLMDFLRKNFGGAEAQPFIRAIPEDWKNFVERIYFPKEPEKMANWQIDFLKQYSEISGIPEKYKELEPLIKKIKSPSESALLNSFLKGQVSLQDYLAKTSYSVKDVEEQYYDVMKEETQLSTAEHVKQFLQGDPMQVGDKLKELMSGQPAGKAAILQDYYKNLPEPIKYDLFSTFQRLVESLKNVARGMPGTIDTAERLINGILGEEYETVNIGGNIIKLPFVYWAPTAEAQKIITDLAKSTWDAWVVDPWIRMPMDIKKSIEEVEEENPLLKWATAGIYPNVAGLWREFSKDPFRMMVNASMVSSNLKYFSLRARFASAVTRSEAAGLAGAGLAYEPGLFSTTTLDIAQALEGASQLIDPMNLLFSTAKAGINTFLDYTFPDLGKTLERRTDLTYLLAQEKHAKIMRAVTAERDATSSMITSLKDFTEAEKVAIRRAMVTGDIESLPAALKTQKVYDAISQNRYLDTMNKRLALESGILDIEQMNARIWADAEKTYGMTKTQLKALGYEPSYVPYLAKQSITGPIEDALNALKPRFEKEFVGDIKTVEKLSLEQAIAKHHIDFANAASDKIILDKMVAYAKQQGFATPWKIGQTLEKGNVIFDPYGYLKKTELAAQFNETFFARLEQLGGDAEAALKLAFSDYSTLEGSAAKLGKLLTPGDIPVFQMPKWKAYEITSNLTNVFNMPLFIERPTAWAKTAYLAGRLGWLVNDFKDNAIRVLMQSGFDATKGNLLAEKWDVLIPDELNFHGIGYDLMSEAVVPASKEAEKLLLFPEARMGKVLSNIENKTWNALYANEPINKFFGKIDSAIDKFWNKDLYINEFVRDTKRGLLKDYAANFAYRWNELDDVAMSMIDDWAANPAAYGKQIALAQERVMKIISNTLYDSSRVLPFLTTSEKGLFKTVFLFPEFTIDCFKKAAMLGIKYPYQSTLLSNLADINNQYIIEEGDRPEWLKDSLELAEDIWLQPIAGTMFDPDWGLMNPNATMNPLVQAAIETITGRDLKTASLLSPFGEPFSDPNQLYYFNPLTQKMEIVSKAETIEEIDKNIEGYQKGIIALLDEIDTLELSGPEVQDRLKRIDQAQRMIKQIWQPQKEMYEAGVPTTPEAPSFMELYLRKLPQWKLLEDALQPYTKVDTATLLEPTVILDKRTGEPKHKINVWLQVLRLLGASVVEYDVEKWREKEVTLKKAQQTVTFGQLINRLGQDDPEMLAKIREDIISGKIPLEWKNLPWHEEIEAKYGKTPTLSPLELPTEFDLETQVKAIEYARHADIQELEDQATEAIENLKFFEPEILSKMRDTIQAVLEEKKSQVNAYYDQIKQSEQLMKMMDELKSAAELKEKLTQMATPVTALEIGKQIIANLKLVDTKIKIKTADLTRALSEYLTSTLQEKKEITYKNVVKDLAEILGLTTTITGKALLDALNKFVKIPASVTLAKQQADWATNRLNELAFIELKKQLTGAYPETSFLAPDLNQLLAEDLFKYYLGTPPETIERDYDLLTDKGLEDAIVLLNADAAEAIRKIQEAAFPFGDLVIKAVQKKTKEAVVRVKKTAATKKRMQVLFTEEKVAGAKAALEKAVGERKDFLSAMSFAHWQDIYDPDTIKTSSGKMPISAMLLALGAARLEILNLFGKQSLDTFLASEEGKQYVDFESGVLQDYRSMIEEGVAPILPRHTPAMYIGIFAPTGAPTTTGTTMDFYNNYVNFIKNPSEAAFNYIKGIHSKSIEEKQKMPVFYRSSTDDNLYATSDISTWKEADLFGVKLQELDRYSRVYSSPEYKAIEKATVKSYTTLSRKLRQGATKSAWFMGVILQK